jgi:hypothetical protein
MASGIRRLGLLRCTAGLYWFMAVPTGVGHSASTAGGTVDSRLSSATPILAVSCGSVPKRCTSLAENGWNCLPGA